MTNGTVVVQAKPWYKSLTVLFNVAAGGAVVAEWALGQGFGFTASPLFTGAVAAINFALRFRTVRPVAASDKQVDVQKSSQGGGA